MANNHVGSMSNSGSRKSPAIWTITSEPMMPKAAAGFMRRNIIPNPSPTMIRIQQLSGSRYSRVMGKPPLLIFFSLCNH